MLYVWYVGGQNTEMFPQVNHFAVETEESAEEVLMKHTSRGYLLNYDRLSGSFISCLHLSCLHRRTLIYWVKYDGHVYQSQCCRNVRFHESAMVPFCIDNGVFQGIWEGKWWLNWQPVNKFVFLLSHRSFRSLLFWFAPGMQSHNSNATNYK